MDLEGKYIFINKMYEELFNISLNDIKSKTDFDIFPTDIAKKFKMNDTITNCNVKLGCQESKVSRARKSRATTTFLSDTEMLIQ